MERLRRMTQGRLSEIMGDRALGIDKFFRTIGLHRSAKESVTKLDQKSLQMLNAYASGINDFIDHMDLPGEDKSAYLLPPEFIALGIKKVNHWKPEDSLCILKLLNFHLSWNWGQDLLRDVLEKEGLEDMVEELFPFTAEYSHNLVTIIDPEDLKGTPQWSEETLVERYYKSKGKKYVRRLSKAELEAKRLEEERLEREQIQREKEEAERRKKAAEEAELKKKTEEAEA